MELISQGQPFTVIVDFTVTPGAYQKTLSTVKTMLQPNAMLHVLTGSCGDRMKEKRPEVGKICSKYADSVIVTNEDPYTEDPMKIINEVVSGVDQSVCDLQVILDRKEALKVILERAQPNDIVMLCGKGADTTMWVQSGQIPWNEREIVTELLKQQGYSNG
jgi:UDP-N-acetylmuramoyl-L-alanyl-D-glutamate--2,6-diaminopimelate ligase